MNSAQSADSARRVNGGPHWWHGRLPWIGVALVIAAVLAVRGPEITNDSAGYLGHSPTRPPGYPLFLDAMHALAGARWLHAAVLLQSLAALLAAASFVRGLGRRLGAGRVAQLIGAAVLLVGIFGFARQISTEALSLALVLLAASHALDAAEEQTSRPLIVAAVAIAAGLLLRPQLLFLLPAWVVGALAHGLARRGQPGARPLRFGATVALIFAAQWGIQQTDNYARRGERSGAGLAGIQLATAAFFIADSGDAAAISPALTPVDAERAAAIEAHVWHNHLAAGAAPGKYPPAMYFGLVYHDICWGTVARAYGLHQDQDVGVAAWRDFDRSTLAISTRLLARHPLRYLRHVVGLAWFQFKYLLLLAVGMVGMAVVRLWRGRREPRDVVAIAWLWAGGLWLTNVLMVCMVELPLGRYSLYTDSLLVCVLLATVRRAKQPEASADP